MNENELLLKRNLRDEVMNDKQLEVLDKVKVITTLKGTDLSITEQVANYYNVGTEAINSCVKRNKDELENNGLMLLKRSELANVFECPDWTFKSGKGKTEVINGETIINITNTGLRLFSKRSILNIGMLLEESPIAKEIRTLLLDNHFQLQDVHEKLVNGEEINIDKTSPTYFIDIETKLREQEKTIISKMTEAIMKGDMQSYMAINCEANSIKEQIILLGKEKEELVKPKVQGYDKFIGTDNLLSWDTVAKNLNWGRNLLLKQLRIHKILQTDEYEYKGKTYHGEHHNIPYQQYMKYFEVKFSTYGNKKSATTKVRAIGQEYILKKLNEWDLKKAN
jgi:phage antirepressor YoqD-like protein